MSSELAPDESTQQQFTDTAIIKPSFELIHNYFDRDPEGHLFSAIWDFDIDIHDLTYRRNPTDKDRNEAIKAGDAVALHQFRPVINTGTELLRDLFTQIEFMQPPYRLSEFEEGRNELLHSTSSDNAESDHFMYMTLDRAIRLHKAVLASLRSATDLYYSEAYWKDPSHKQGLDIDQIELLYDCTDAFEGRGLLKALDQIEDARAFTKDIMIEARRIAKIMVAKENNII